MARLDRHAASGEPVDLEACYFAFTMDTFCEIAFGAHGHNSQQEEHRFTQAFDTAQRLCNQRFSRPWCDCLPGLRASSTG